MPIRFLMAMRWLFGALLLAPLFAFAATLQVGAGKPYQTIAAAVTAAQAGDTIAIDAGVYSNETMTISKNDLTLRGVGGRAHLRWGTGNYLTNTTNIGNGKGIFVISGNNVTIENIEFSGAKVVSENGAGIRYEGGNLTIRGSYFHHNENGILGQGGLSNTLIIENSIFEQNGYCPVDCTHNVYIGRMGTLIFRYNKSIDSKVGHLLKSRAHVNEVVGNYLSTRNSDGSYEANFPNGGTVYFIGNVVEQGVNTGNSSLISYGEEGSINPNPALHVVNNTFNNLRGSGSVLSTRGTPALTIKNNILTGGTSFGATVDSSNKVLPASTFVNAAGGNYRLAAKSAAIDAGVTPGSAGTYNLTPQWEYVEPASSVARVTSGVAIDVGAYEFGSGTVPDTAPDAFGFAAQNGVAINTVVTSNTITPVGYNAAAPISVSAGGSYSINGGAFVSTAGTISPGQNVAVRQTSSAAFSTTSTVILTIGGVAGAFAAMTQVPPAPPDTTPDAFGFTAQNGVAVNTVVTSNAIAPAGYDAAAPISISAGGSYSINGGAFVSTAGTISPGQSVAVRLTAAQAHTVQTCVTLSIGGVAGVFCVTTIAGLPGTPTAVVAQAGAASSITLRFGPPASNGGSAVTDYGATCISSNSGVSGTGAAGADATSIQVRALSAGRIYTCSVTATNALGSGPASAWSNAVTPIDATPILNLLLDEQR